MCATDDFMLCKAESRDPAHCLKEGRRVTRCAQDLCVFPFFPLQNNHSQGCMTQDFEDARELSGAVQGALGLFRAQQSGA